jgi:2-hydroxychromene-2-carboxylate isomerase
VAAPIEFYFDFSSPYGYIASRLIDDLAARHDRTVVWRPVLLGVIFKLTGTAPLVQIPLKGDYSRRDFARTARFHGVPFQMPDPFPFSGVAANRAFYWLDDTDPAKARDLARALYGAAFGGMEIGRPESVANVAQGIGIDRDRLLEGSQSPEAKARTRAENDDAIAKGVFGSPYFIADGEPFFGTDRLDQLDRWLATGGW